MKSVRFLTGVVASLLFLGAFSTNVQAKHHVEDNHDVALDCDGQLAADKAAFVAKYPDLSEDDVYDYKTYEGDHGYYRVYDNVDAFTEAQKIKAAYKICLSKED